MASAGGQRLDLGMEVMQPASHEHRAPTQLVSWSSPKGAKCTWCRLFSNFIFLFREEFGSFPWLLWSWWSWINPAIPSEQKWQTGSALQYKPNLNPSGHWPHSSVTVVMVPVPDAGQCSPVCFLQGMGSLAQHWQKCGIVFPWEAVELCWVTWGRGMCSYLCPAGLIHRHMWYD